MLGWIFAKQAEFYRALSGAIRAAKADGSAAWTLFGISFLYGVFHAAGPGHGKAVISSYLVANEETWKRGVVLSFASALLQALVAVVIVGIAAVLLNATAHAIGLKGLNVNGDVRDGAPSSMVCRPSGSTTRISFRALAAQLKF